MSQYIDGFVFPIKRRHLEAYRQVAEQVAKIWKEHGALSYFEYEGDDMTLEGTRSFPNTLGTKVDETIIFGWTVFPSKAVRNQANEQVPTDPRMAELVAPLMDSNRLIFDASRMVYGGFKSLVQSG